MSIKRITGQAIASGPVTSLPAEKYYSYGGDNFHIPKERATPADHPLRSSEARKERIEEYCRLRSEGKSPAEAARAVDVEKRTRQRYEKEWESRQAGGPS